MKRIITISREFGSGGRELGKRLADEMNLPVYDHEIIEKLAEEHDLTTDYIESISEQGFHFQYAQTIGHSFTVKYPAADQQLKMIKAQEALIRQLAEYDCIIVGRAADVLLWDKNPFKLFVYADMSARINRCMERADEEEGLTPEQMRRKIKRIDRDRASYHALFADTVWGRKENYTLCVNTTGIAIKNIVKPVSAYIASWYEHQEAEHE